jgi:hypothetical protein
MAASKELLLTIDGPHTRPDTVEDPLLFLQVAASWFKLAAKVAEARSQTLHFHGLNVRDKCLAFASMPSNARLAQAVVSQTAKIVLGIEDAPTGADGTTDEVRASIRALHGHTISVRIGTWAKALAAPAGAGPMDRWERTELRVQPIRVGGMQQMTVKLASRSEGVAFTVAVRDEAHARLLGANLYRDIDVELRLRRGHDDVIKDGEILDVHELETESPGESWRAWFKENAGEWADVDNILGELGRSH